MQKNQAEENQNPQTSAAKRPLAGRLLRAAAFILLSVCIWRAIDFALTDDIHAYSRVMLQELYAANGSVDTLFLGASHCYRSFDPALVDEMLGTNSFVAGSSQQLPDGSYYMLREAGAENPLKTVYLECFFSAFTAKESKDIPLACYLLSDYMRPSANKYAYLLEMGGAAALVDDLLPARHTIASPEEIKEVWHAKLTDGYQSGNYRYVTYPGEEEYRGRGFVYTYGTPQYGFGALGDIDAAQPLSDFGQEYLEKIADDCQEKGIRLVLVTAPLPSAFVENQVNYQAFVDWMRQFAAAHGTEYWDFTLYKDTAALPLDETDFLDAHHLNGQGAEKFTAAFCTVVQQQQAGQDTANLFYDTVAQKLAQAPDGTLPQ